MMPDLRFNSNQGRNPRPGDSPVLPAAAEPQKCLRAVLALLAEQPDYRVMVGPPNREFDTRHFWAVAPDGTIADPTDDSYPFYLQGRPFDLGQNAEVLAALLSH